MGKIVSQTEIKSDGDVFHKLWGSMPHHIPNIIPDKVQGCDLHEGEWGTIGSVIFWNYVHDGKAKVLKEVIDKVDEKNKTVILRAIEGDLLDLYKSFVVTLHVDTKGENTLVTWTFEYEKLIQMRSWTLLLPSPKTLRLTISSDVRDRSDNKSDGSVMRSTCGNSALQL
ncbi:hypothetical protein RJ639_044508 [Escallonia herrerae]|uniref:Bet v I/Major latex protein domain-containing protein n=1 Tax=Escallonia herrerae TaxID=1293975 RepID=A0AA88WD63_9ASTE|nr:hypothetical protein RJ639_044508 [Escallonia herrerae]